MDIKTLLEGFFLGCPKMGDLDNENNSSSNPEVLETQEEPQPMDDE